MPDQKTQSERILILLKQSEAVCGTTLLEAYIPRYAAVIHRLRTAGHQITTRGCTRPHHDHTTPQVEYSLAGQSIEA